MKTEADGGEAEAARQRFAVPVARQRSSVRVARQRSSVPVARQRFAVPVARQQQETPEGAEASGAKPHPGELLCCWSGVRVARQQQDPPQQHPGRRRGERSEAPPQRAAHVLCCCVVVFCGPGLRPCRRWRGSSRIHRSRRPRKAQRRAQRSPTPKSCSCVVLLCCWSGVRVARQQQQDPPQQHPVRRIGERSEAPPEEKGFVSLFVLCPLRYLLLVCR